MPEAEADKDDIDEATKKTVTFKETSPAKEEQPLNEEQLKDKMEKLK